MSEAFHIRRIRLIHFHNFVDETLPVRRNLFLVGDNQSGKSTVLDAVHFALTAGVDPADAPLRLRRNAQVQTGVALAQDNRNALVHSEDEAWPWRGACLWWECPAWISWPILR